MNETDRSKMNKVMERIVTARIHLLIKQPFFGNMATRLEIVNADAWCKTCATDGRKFYYNTDFVLGLDEKNWLQELVFVFCHEVLHCCYEHMDRRNGRDPILANIAADYVVNYDIVEQKIGSMPSMCLYDKKFAGMCFEEVYQYLYDNAEKINMSSLSNKVLDEHIGSDPSTDDSEGSGSGGDGGKRPMLTEAERREIKDEIRQAMLAAIESSGAGNVPSGIQRIMKDFLEPKISWRELLEQQIESIQKSDFSWMRPSRRSWHSDAIMPGMIPGCMVDVAVAIDTSGSISNNDLKTFLSEIKGIMEQYDDFKLSVWCFDTNVHAFKTFSKENEDDLSSYEPAGGGGTDFMANWTWMNENDIQPKKFVVFTDGMPFGSWGDENYCDTVWIIKGNPSVVPPFGAFAHYEKLENGGK